MNKKAVCISCFQNYENRTELVGQYLQHKGYDCTYITSDFDHIHKRHFISSIAGTIQIPTRPYYKNLSFARLFSHCQFSKKAKALLDSCQPDLLYVMLPPNTLGRAAVKYKRQHPNTKLIFDIYDMWPETFPNAKLKRLLKLPFALWARLRNSSLSAADIIFTECDLYRKVLAKHLLGKSTAVLHLCRPETTVESAVCVPDNERLHLCYLGSINNIIDIPTISALIGHLQAFKPVVLHIVGAGESKEALIEAVTATGAQIRDHGKIYDPELRQGVFDECHFGLNIMKESVCVGLTMKSLDYFAGGLPILNAIPADTWDLVTQKGIGFNIDRNNLKQTAESILAQTPEENLEMRNATLSAFQTLFTKEQFLETLSLIESIN